MLLIKKYKTALIMLYQQRNVCIYNEDFYTKKMFFIWIIFSFLQKLKCNERTTVGLYWYSILTSYTSSEKKY